MRRIRFLATASGSAVAGLPALARAQATLVPVNVATVPVAPSSACT